MVGPGPSSIATNINVTGTFSCNVEKDNKITRLPGSVSNVKRYDILTAILIVIH